MTTRKILIEPDPILRKKSSPLEKVDDQTRKLMKDMLETMYKAPGIGLAAAQIGILKRIVVIDITKDEVRVYTKGQDFHKEERELPYASIDGKIKSFDNFYKEVIGDKIIDGDEDD